MRSRRLTFLLCAAALAGLGGALLATSGGRADAAGPTTIARAMPGGAVVYLEAADLRRALEVWSGSALRQGWEGGAADQAMRKNRLVLRLGEHLGALEELAGFELTLPRLITLAGDQAGIALYRIEDVEFVFQTELAAGELARTPFEKAKKRLAQRRYAGVPYYLGGARGGPQLAFALVGNRLVVSNSVARFHAALVLAAREERVKTDGTKPGAAMADDAAFTALAAAGPADAAVRVWARMSELHGTHYFDDYWIFGGGAARLDGLAAALLCLRVGKGALHETRLYRYADAAAAPVAGAPAGGAAIGQVDVARAAAALPARGLAASVEPADGARAADRLARLLPAIAPEPGRKAPAVAARLAELLAAAGPTRLVEQVALDTTPGRGGPARTAMPVVRRGGALAVRLAQPDRLDAAALEAAVVDYVRFAVGDGAPLPLAFADAGGGLRALALPLFDGGEWRLTVGRADGGRTLIVASSPALAGALAGELGRADGVAALLAAQAPLAARVDLSAAARRWGDLAEILGGRRNWASSDDEAFVTAIVPSAFAAAAATSAVTVGYRSGTLFIEELEVR